MLIERRTCKDEGRDHVMLLWAFEHQRWTADHQKLGEAWNRLPLTASEGTNPAETLILDFLPTEMWEQ